MKNDILSRSDIELLVNTFYDKVRANKIIGPIFNDIAKVNWETHLPKMYSFWWSLLLGEHSFSGNPMQKHIALSKLTTMTEVEFSEWLSLFTQTTDELFVGEKAEEAKIRAANIARLMLHKIQKI
ncbi:MAG: group III truncated hemoglobin [Bacteroidia bacterium]|nr:group III truncated hemoglobin [Bacteroidia bacterium]